MTQARCLQATVSELFNKWLHRECKHEVLRSRRKEFQSRRATLSLGSTREKLQRKSFLALTKRVCRFQVSELKKDVFRNLTRDHDRV